MKTFKKILIATSALISLCATSLTAFAEGEGSAASQQGNPQAQQSPLLYYGFMIVMFLVVGYFFLIRPEKKRKKEAQDLRDNLKPGNRITTIGGIVGTVEKVTDDEIYLTNGLVLKRFALRSIEDATPENAASPVTYYEDEEDEGENK